MSLHDLKPESDNRYDNNLLNSILYELLMEQKLTNLYLSKVIGEDLRLDNELENR